MKLSLKWLADYVALPGSVDDLAKKLTMAGLEIEGISRPGEGLRGIVVAQILSSEKHPNADKLSVTKIDDGSGTPLQVVCGAKNYKVGDKVPLATVGTVMPGGRAIGRAEMRGVESCGMLCSAKELGLPEGVDGLLILPADARPGANSGIGSGGGYDGPETLPVVVRPVALKRAVANLVGNAMAYGGTARIVLQAPRDGIIAIHVDDDGPGIAIADMDRVFEPFQRLENSRNRETGGSGLGLPITRNILRAHGGDVTLANRAGGGLRATMILPA